jgi:hypothetical protein
MALDADRLAAGAKASHQAVAHDQAAVASAFPEWTLGAV